jgi:flagellar hook-basal body complex protein FliE
MQIDRMNPLVNTYKGIQKTEQVEKTGFADLLRQAIQEVDQTQKTADSVAEAFSMGKVNNVHEVTVAAEQASLALELTIAVRNKAMEAYKEIMRMQF